MPTYQSAPLYPVIFPDEAVAMNPEGFRRLKGNKMEITEFPAGGPDYQYSWPVDAAKRVTDKVNNTKLAKEAMLHGPPSIKGNRAFTTTRGPFPGHSLMLSGGTVWTREGEAMVNGLLNDRIQELNLIAQTNLDSVPAPRPASMVPQDDTLELDQKIADLASNLNSGIVNNTLLENTNFFMSFLFSKANSIPEYKFGEYKDIVGEMLESIEILNSEIYDREELKNYFYGEAQTIIKLLDKTYKDLSAINKFIDDYNEVLQNPSRSKMVLNKVRNKLLKLIRQNLISGIPPAFSGESSSVASAEFPEGYQAPSLY